MGRIISGPAYKPPRPSICGKLKIGEKIEYAPGKSRPAAIDYFKPTGLDAALIYRKYGEKPNNLIIRFSCDDEDFVASQEYQIWNGSIKIAKGTGGKFWIPSERADAVQGHVWISKDDVLPSGELMCEKYPKFATFEPGDPLIEGKIKDGFGNYKFWGKDKNGNSAWTPPATFRFSVLTEIGERGLWELHTNSTNGASAIFDAIDKAKEEDGLKNTLFRLSVRMHTGTETKSKYPMLSITKLITKQDFFNPDFEEIAAQISPELKMPVRYLSQNKTLEISDISG
jgi:hypothetical protein